MNYFIFPKYNDKVFFYCNELRHDQNEKAWEIYVNPEDCLVALDEEVKKIDKSLEKLPTVIELRKQKPQGFKKDNTISYKGNILFSSGVILIINGKILMLQRSKNTIDPEKWTSPAGRCDLDPELTGLKEFYEELILINKKERKPIFVKIGSDYLAIKKIYKNTLEKKKELGDIDISEDNWFQLEAETSTEYRSLLESVTTKFGSTLFKGKFLAYLDEENNTLELRILAELKVDERELENMEFLNGEREYPCRLFSLDEFVKMDNAKLVPAIIYFRDIVSKLARKS
ncbi:MAG: NUDIX hydrolase [Nitrospirae bacterium]|nr:NUDIX hydrolase [Nitrospirota bacterium]MCL5062997.1 NUDIX hydrolase [Nitrospirota bacterium]MDA8337694.1 NUDIX hydrolase [Nitrospiraceae bacterium]